MTTFARIPLPWISLTKVGLALAFLFSQMPVQAQQNKSGPRDPDASTSGSAAKKPGKTPSKHRKETRGPVKPEEHPTKPQQLIPTLR